MIYANYIGKAGQKKEEGMGDKQAEKNRKKKIRALS